MTHISLEELLDIEREAAIDYEITFAALLATALLSVPSVSPPLHPVAIGSAFLLLLVTLIRRMAFLNPYSKDLLGQTTPPLVISTAFGLLYLGLVLGDFTQAYVPFVNPHQSTLALLYTVGLCLGSLLVYEIWFRDFFLLIAAFAFNVHLDHRGTFLGWFAIRLSQKSLTISLLPEEERPAEVEHIPSTEQKSPSEVSLRKRILNIIGASLGLLGILTIFALAFLGVYLLLSTVTDPSIGSIAIVGGLLAIAVNYLIVSLRFLYGRYGLTPYTEIAPPKRYTYYSLVLYALFFVHMGYEYGILTWWN